MQRDLAFSVNGAGILSRTMKSVGMRTTLILKKEKLKSKAKVSSVPAADKGSDGKKAKVSSVSATDKGSAEVTDEDQSIEAPEDKGMLHEAA